MCVDVWVSVCHGMYVESENSLLEWFSFHHMGPWDWIQVVMHGSKCPNLQRHLTGSVRASLMVDFLSYTSYLFCLIYFIPFNGESLISYIIFELR